MVSFIEAAFLGIIQGLTEWLPISSSGHLVIVQQLLHIKISLFFDVMLHFGTLLAVIVFMRKDILEILKSLLKLDFTSQSGKLLLFVIIGSIPITFFGFFFHEIIEAMFSNLYVVGLSLLITGAILYLTKNTRGKKKLRLKDSILVGIVQAFALIPGISRSGSTISTGLLRDIDKKLAFKFSFLLAVPAVIGANLLELTNVIVGNIQINLLQAIVSTLISFIAGYISLKFLYNLLQKGKFYLFCYYCWMLGTLLLLYRFFI